METSRRVEARFEADRWSGEAWVVAGATIEERLNEPFRITIDVAQAEPDAEAGSLLGSSCRLTLARRANAASPSPSTCARISGTVMPWKIRVSARCRSADSAGSTVRRA